MPVNAARCPFCPYHVQASRLLGCAVLCACVLCGGLRRAKYARAHRLAMHGCSLRTHSQPLQPMRFLTC